MSKSVNQTLKCKKCGAKFEATFYESINISLDPELKEKVLNGDIYVFECPYCHEKHYIQYPFLYHDMEHKFMIQQGGYESLMENYFDYICKENKGPQADFLNLLNDYTNIGCPSYTDFKSKVVMLENGLDYRIATMYEYVMISKYEYYMEQNKDNSTKVVDSFFAKDKEGKLIVVLNLESNDEKHEQHFVSTPFDEETYNKLKDDYSKELDNVFTYFFDKDTAIKYIASLENENFEDLKATKMEFAIVELTNHNGTTFAFVPAFNNGKYSKGDDVVIMKDSDIVRGKITSIYEMSEFEFPLRLSDIPVVAWHSKSIELTSTKGSDDKLDNTDVIKMLLEFKNNNGKLNESLLGNADVILSTVVTLKDQSLNPEELKVGDIINPNQIKSVLAEKEIHGDKFIRIYLSQDHVPSEEGLSKAVFKFKDVVEMALQKCGYFRGIIICCSNDEKDDVIFPYRHLLTLRKNLIMNNEGKMREILLNLTKEEIAYIGQQNYDIISKFYFSDTSPKELSKFYNMSEKEMDETIGESYWLLKHIIWDNY